MYPTVNRTAAVFIMKRWNLSSELLAQKILVTCQEGGKKFFGSAVVTSRRTCSPASQRAAAPVTLSRGWTGLQVDGRGRYRRTGEKVEGVNEAKKRVSLPSLPPPSLIPRGGSTLVSSLWTRHVASPSSTVCCVEVQGPTLESSEGRHITCLASNVHLPLL